MTDDAPGWKPDPSGTHDHRYWDGSQWTENVSDAGVAAVDPYVAPAPDAPAEPTPEPPAAAEPPPPAPAEPDATIVGAAGGSADPTAAWPTAPGAPAPPPPYAAPPPVTGGGSGGSKRGLLIGAGILAAVVAAVIAVLALGGDDTSVRAQLASKLQDEESSLSGGQAECVADLIVDEAGEDAFEDTDWDADDPPPEFISALLAVGLTTLAEECDISEGAFGGGEGTDGSDGSTTDGSGEEGSYGSDAELDALYDDCEAGDYQACDDLFFQSPTDSEYERFGDTCGDRNEPSGTCVSLYGEDGAGDGGFTDSGALPDNFEEIIADTYVTSLGLDRDKAECLAEKIGGAIRDGLLNEEDAFTEVFDYLEACDISMEEISGG